MKRLISIVLLLIPISAYATTPKVIPSKDITYLGAFKLPTISGYGWRGSDPGGDAINGMEYLPTDGTLLVIPVRSGIWIKDVAKVSIPAPINSKNLNDLNTAILLKGPVDIAKGRQGGYSILGDIHYLPAKGNQERGHLYWSIYGGYQSDAVYIYSNGHFGWAELDLDNLNPVGAWRFKDCKLEDGVTSYYLCSSFSGKYLFHAPQAWADTYTGGRSLLQGYKRSGGGMSTGGVIWAFAPWGVYQPENVAGNDTDSIPPDARDGAAPYGSEVANPNHYFEHTPLLQYGMSTGSAGVIPPHQVTDAAVNTSISGGRWISLGSKRAIVLSGNQCYRTYANFEWSYPANYYPGTYYEGDNEGYHAAPCGPVFWFYSQDDITDVAQGTKNVYDPQPYSRMNLTPYLINTERPGIYGMAYNESDNKLYVEEPTTSGGSVTGAVIHVFQLTDVGSSLDVTRPSAPTLVLDSANKTSVTFHWGTITDDSGSPTTCMVYRNGSPIAIQPCSTTSYTDSYLAYYLSPVDYQVKAIDNSGNISTSNTLSIDNSVGGNVPMTIYIPTYAVPESHETSSIKFPYNEYYSFTPTVRGGTAPYTWSVNALPTGLTINSSTGEISGTGTINGESSYGYNITVTDANGNKASRKTSISISTAYYCDRDQDGVKGTYSGCGGTDTNDNDCNSTPGASYSQPPPGSLTVTGSTSSTVSLSWTAAPKRSDPSYNSSGRSNLNGLDIGYQVYHGTLPGIWDAPVFVGRNTTYTATGLTAGIHYFTVNAVEFRGLESVKSTAVQQTIGCVTTYTLTTTVSPSGAGLVTGGGTYCSGNTATVTAMAASGKEFSSWSKDLSGGTNPTSISLNGNKSVTANFIDMTDTLAPTVTAFVIPSTSNSLTVSISTFIANDNVGVTGYMVSESATKPSASDSGWSSSAPTTYSFKSAGAKTLYGYAKDAAGNVSNGVPANVTITLADTTPPTVTSFTIPSTSSSLTVSITSFTATDNVGVTGYLITESPTAPSANASGWVGSAPSTYVAGSTGTKVLYAWAKDVAGNVSTSLSGSVTIVLPGRVILNGTAYGAYYAEGMDVPYHLAETSDGGIAMFSTTWSYSWNPAGEGNEAARGFLLKINSSGVEQWRRIIGPEGYNITTKQTGTDEELRGSGITASATNLITVGYRGTYPNYSAFMMKFDSSGTNVWDRTFTGTGNRYLRNIVERAGGGFAAVGDDGDAWLLLTDAKGENPVNTYYNTNGKGYIQMRTIKKTSDGGYIMVGHTTTGGAYDEDYYVVKTTFNGTQSWAYRYDNSGRRDIATSVEEDASGNYWVFGRSQKLSDPKVENTRIWIVKVNSSGVYQTSYEIGDTNDAHAYVARGSIKLSSGNFLIIGYTNVSSGSGYHGYITEINTSGQVQRTPLTIGASSTGWTENYLFNGVVSSNGDYYYICGTDNQAFSTAYDLWFLKLSTSDLSVQNTTPCQKATYYYDKDLDGFGNNNQWSEPTGDACFAMPGYVLNHNDPDDSDPSVTPDTGPLASPKDLRIIIKP